MNEQSKPSGLRVIGVLLILASLSSIFYGIFGYLVYFAVAVAYALLGVGLIKSQRFARIGTLIVLPLIAIVSMGSVAGSLFAQNDPEMLKELVEMGIDPDSLNSKIIIGSIRVLVAFWAFIYLMTANVKNHFNNQIQAGDDNSD